MDSPVFPGDTYEDWCRVMQAESFKEQMSDGRASLRTNWFNGNLSSGLPTYYHEYSDADGDLHCSIGCDGIRDGFKIDVEFRDGILVNIEIHVQL